MKIYTLAELQTHNFDDKEIIDVLNKNTLVKLCIIAMFRYVKSNLSDEKILQLITIDNWMNKKYWSWKEHDNFIKALALVYKNIYQYNNRDAIYLAQEFVFKYGFKIKDSKSNENKHFKHLLNYDL